MSVGSMDEDLTPLAIGDDTPVFASYPALTSWAVMMRKKKEANEISLGHYMSHFAFHLKKERSFGRPMHRKFLANKVDATFLFMLDSSDFNALAYWSQYISGKAAMKAIEILAIPIPDSFELTKYTAPSFLLTTLVDAANAQTELEKEDPAETWEPLADEIEPEIEVEPEAVPEPEVTAEPEATVEAKPKLPVSSKKLSEIKGLTRAILIQMSQKALGAKNSTLSVGALLELVEADAPLVVRHTGHKAQNQTPIFSDWAWNEESEGIPAHVLVHYTYEEQETPENIILRKWEPKLDADGNPLPHKCPKCGVEAQSSSEDDLIALFGRLRVVKSKTKKGIVHRERPQSQCKACRAGYAKKKKAEAAEEAAQA